MERSLVLERQAAQESPRIDSKRRTLPAEQSKSKLRSALHLLAIWGSAGILSLVLVISVYTVFFSRSQAEYNETIYENYRLVNVPHTTQLYTQEGYGLTSYGENGLVVDKEVNFNIPRLLFLGDSYMEAKQVSDAQKLTEIVERTWNTRHPEQPIQTLNLGAAGEDIRTYLSFGRNMDAYFQPNLVFVMMNRRDFVPLIQQPEQLEQWEADPSFKLVRPQRLSRWQQLVNGTIFRQFFVQLLFQTNGFLQKESADNETAEAELQTGNQDILAGHEAAVADQLRALQSIWGDRLVIIYNVHVPNFGEGAADTHENDTLMQTAAQLGIPVINLYEPMLKAFREGRPPRGFHNARMGIGHFNEYGHEIIAAQVLGYMEQVDWRALTAQEEAS